MEIWRGVKKGKTMAKPMVCMVVPCYNKVGSIDGMFRSICCQTWDAIRLVLVDDASNDGTSQQIDEWIPRFEERGYEVVCLRHTVRQGVAAAINTGMASLSGEYFCTVDCDDELHPDYVADMAGWLLENPDYDGVACGFARAAQLANGQKRDETSEYLANPGGTGWTFNYLFFRCPAMVWMYMATTAYIKKCGLAGGICHQPAGTQEPQMVLALSEGGGRFGYLPQRRYTHWVDGGQHYMDSLQVRLGADMAEVYQSLAQQTAGGLPLGEARRQWLEALLPLAAIKWSYIFNVAYRHHQAKKAWADAAAAQAANGLFKPNPEFTAGQVEASGYRVFFQAVEDGIQNSAVERKSKAIAGRVIAYGALGNLGRELLPPLCRTPLRPAVIWDAAADESTGSWQGVPVCKPEFSTLTPQDTLLVLPRLCKVRQAVENQLALLVAPPVCLYHFDVLAWLARYFYPQMYSGVHHCKISNTNMAKP